MVAWCWLWCPATRPAVCLSLATRSLHVVPSLYEPAAQATDSVPDTHSTPLGTASAGHTAATRLRQGGSGCCCQRRRVPAYRAIAMATNVAKQRRMSADTMDVCKIYLNRALISVVRGLAAPGGWRLLGVTSFTRQQRISAQFSQRRVRVAQNMRLRT